MHYPVDEKTLRIERQFFYSPSLINPVTREYSTSVSFYLPSDTWYDFYTLKPVPGASKTIEYTNVADTDVPVIVRGGPITPLRVKRAMTAKALRGEDFELHIAPDKDGNTE